MVKAKFLENLFQGMSLKISDVEKLQDIANTLAEAYMKRYQYFSDEENNKVDKKIWKFIKAKKQMRVYLERQPKHCYAPFSRKSVVEDSDLQTLLCVGSAPGTLEDVMLGVMGPVFDTNSSAKNELSRAVVLKTIKEPTTVEPFRSVVVKWLELDVRLQSMGFVRNRDYVYVEATGILHLPSGGRVGYHLMHSVGFSEAHVLPGRVRAKLSVCFSSVKKAKLQCRCMLWVSWIP